MLEMVENDHGGGADWIQPPPAGVYFHFCEEKTDWNHSVVPCVKAVLQYKHQASK